MADQSLLAVPATRSRLSFPKGFGSLSSVGAFVWLAAILGLAALAPALPLDDPAAGGLEVAAPPSWDRLLGTDQVGRDMLSRVIYGARTSIVIALASVAVSCVLGVAAGLIAGYVRGAFDRFVTGVTDVALAFPGLILAMVIATLVGPSPRNLILVLAFYELPAFIRLGRANTIAFAQREFISAARGLGARDLRIMTLEVLPNVIPTVTAYSLAALAAVFVTEGSLSFLGLGIQPPTPAWGSMIAAGRNWLLTAPYIVLIPSVVLFLTVLSLNLVARELQTEARPAQLGG